MPPAPAPARLEETATFLSKPPRSAQLMATLLSSTGPRAGPVTRHLISRVPSTEPGASARCGRSDGVRWPCEDSGVRPPPAAPPHHGPRRRAGPRAHGDATLRPMVPVEARVYGRATDRGCLQGRTGCFSSLTGPGTEEVSHAC